MRPDRPNILFLLTDQQRFDHLSCRGNRVLRTPHIDSIASRGTRFDRHYCNHPLCSPSRATILTGRYPRSHRVYDNGCCLSDSEETLPAVLSKDGYDTVAIGKIHVSSVRETEGVSFESGSFWEGPNAPSGPVSYAGFDTVEICTRHISPNTGHYGLWLRENHPEVFAQWESYLTPDPLGAPETYHWTLPPEAHANSWIADRTIDYLKRQAGSSRPFFMQVGFPDPHHPFRAPEPWGSMYDPSDIRLPDTLETACDDRRPPEYAAYRRGALNFESLGEGDFNTVDLPSLTPDQWKRVIATTYGMISFVDQQIGRILQALEENGQMENTIIVFSSDHGDYMGDHGLLFKAPFLLEGLVKVPLLISTPACPRRSRNTHALTCHADLMPTFLEFTGTALPRGIEGKSFAGLMEDDSAVCREGVLIECLHQFQFDRNVKALVTDRWKLVHWGGCEYGELYDLANDPTESNNLWREPACRETLAELRRQLLDEILLTENILPLPLAPT